MTYSQETELHKENLQTVANLLNQSQDLQDHDGHSPASRKMAKQVGETLIQVYSALSNGDSGLARTLLSDLDGMEEQLGCAPRARTTPSRTCGQRVELAQRRRAEHRRLCIHRTGRRTLLMMGFTDELKGEFQATEAAGFDRLIWRADRRDGSRLPG